MSKDINLPRTLPNRALLDLRLGKSSAHFELEVTPAGLVAASIFVSGILLSVAPIVTAATRHLRQN